MAKITPKESQNIEYKSNWQDEYLKWICGFANAQGAVMYFGVNDDHEIIGLKNVEKLMEDIPNKIVNFMGIVVDVNLHEVDGLDYLEVEIAPSSVPISYKGKYYYRSGSTMQELNGPALQQFVLKKMGRSWDDMVHERATVDDLDRDAIDFFLRKGIQAGRIDPSEANAPTANVLQNLNLVDDEGHLKNAALLLFCKKPGRYFTGTEFKIGRFHSNIADLVSQEMIECSIIQMADRVVRMLKDKFLTMPIHYEGLQRIESLEVPEDALREILYNAICHKDYLGPQIQMRVWDHHVEVWNNGELPAAITPENIEKVHASYPRNKNLAFVFYKAGFIESWGRGWQKICDGFQAAGLPKPTIESNQGGVLVTFQRNNVNLKANAEDIGQDKDVLDAMSSKMSNIMSNKMSKKEIERMEKILSYLGDNVFITKSEAAKILQVEDKTAQRLLAKAESLNILLGEGENKGKRYKLNPSTNALSDKTGH